MRLVVVGAGGHSQRQHLPSLARYQREHPGEIELVALCDLKADLAAQAALRFGFARTYTDLGEMLCAERPDGCVAVTPISATASVAIQVIEAGVPLCMEKPPGATRGEAREVAELVDKMGARVMVSVNRRFDPALTTALEWWGDHPMTYVQGCMARVNRREDVFITGTAIHALDALRAIVGDVHHQVVQGRMVDGVRWFFVRLVFEGGAVGTLDIMPTAGQNVERYEICGPGRRAIATSGYLDTGDVCCWEGGRLAVNMNPTAGMPDYVRAGSYAETCALIASLEERRPLRPSPTDVVPSLELCYQISEAFPG